MNRSLKVFPLFILVLVVGCDQPLRRANVKGTVTFNGKPLDKGEITFVVQGQPPSVMDIVDGKFTGTAMVGENFVVLSAKRKATGAAAPKLTANAKAQMKGYQEYMRGKTASGDVPDLSTMVETIPPEWSTKSKQTRVVEAGGANDFDFNIKGK